MNKENTLYTKENLIKKLITIIKNYDHETAYHCLRVGLYTSLFLTYLKKENISLLNFDEKDLKDIVYSASIHDIGKIYVSPHIIVEGEINSDSDILEIKEHTKIGTLFFNSENSKIIYEGILYHHERFDGEGYPFGLKGNEISIIGRLLNLADSYDAMTTKRPYMTNAKTTEESLSEIKENLGTQFDPILGEHFLKMFEIPQYKQILTYEKNSPELIENLKTMLDWLSNEESNLENPILNNIFSR